MARLRQHVNAFAIIYLLTILVTRGAALLPLPIPPAPTPADSPFPAEGFWLLVGSQSHELDGTAVIANSEAIRKEPGLESRWQDYDQSDLEAPWQAALDHAQSKSGGKPYYVARHGNKTAEGELTGSVEDKHKVLVDAVEGLR